MIVCEDIDQTWGLCYLDLRGFFSIQFFSFSLSFSVSFFFLGRGGRFMHRDKLMISSHIKSTIFVLYSKMAG